LKILGKLVSKQNENRKTKWRDCAKFRGGGRGSTVNRNTPLHKIIYIGIKGISCKIDISK